MAKLSRHPEYTENPNFSENSFWSRLYNIMLFRHTPETQEIDWNRACDVITTIVEGLRNGSQGSNSSVNTAAVLQRELRLYDDIPEDEPLG